MTFVRRVPAWAVAVAVVAALLLAGALPTADAVALARRVGPILVFLAAITVVAEMCSHAGLFDAAAQSAARLARGRRVALWALFVVLAVASTVVLSLDTTAVLLTPVAIAVGRRTGTSAMALALTVVALANTASLALPVSNLTNLLAASRFAEADPPVGYVPTMAVPALAVVATTVLVLGLLHRRALRGRFELTPAAGPQDVVGLRWTGLVVAGLAVCFVVELPVAPVALVGAAVLVTVSLTRGRGLPVPPSRMVPWRMLLLVGALLAVVETWHQHGLGDVLAHLAGTGNGAGDLAQVGVVGALGANAVNNLPAYLALEPTVAHDPARLAALLVGVDAGPLITPWASLATILWWHQCRRHGFEAAASGWWPVVRQGLVLAPLVVGAGLLAVVLTA